MNRRALMQQLAQTRSHIEFIDRQIAKQEARIDKQNRAGNDAPAELGLLAQFKEHRNQHIRRRDLLKEQLAELPPE
jgi:septal ring factor EnvC (AmiA/AmiB activator)